MARIVGIHGAFHQFWGPHQLWSRWLPAVQDGLWHHELELDPADFAVAFYGDLFRREAAAGRPDRGELMELAARTGFLETLDDEFGPGGLEVLAGMVGRHTVRTLVDQGARYFDDGELRAAIVGRLAAIIEPDTRVIVAHSLGTVVAYEALAANDDWPVTTLVTLGSPLGNEFVFERLRPAPVGSVGAWPGAVDTWVNIAAVDDPVIDVPDLSGHFADRVVNVAVDNGRDAHRAEPYLNAHQTGAILARALDRM